MILINKKYIFVNIIILLLLISSINLGVLIGEFYHFKAKTCDGSAIALNILWIIVIIIYLVRYIKLIK